MKLECTHFYICKEYHVLLYSHIPECWLVKWPGGQLAREAALAVAHTRPAAVAAARAAVAKAAAATRAAEAAVVLMAAMAAASRAKVHADAETQSNEAERRTKEMPSLSVEWIAKGEEFLVVEEGLENCWTRVLTNEGKVGYIVNRRWLDLCLRSEETP